MFPGMIKMIVRIVGPGAVADPFAIGMDVRRVRMSGLVVEVRGCPAPDAQRPGAGPCAGMFLTPPPTS